VQVPTGRVRFRDPVVPPSHTGSLKRTLPVSGSAPIGVHELLFHPGAGVVPNRFAGSELQSGFMAIPVCLEHFRGFFLTKSFCKKREA
jgi:hypothetical protein